MLRSELFGNEFTLFATADDGTLAAAASDADAPAGSLRAVLRANAARNAAYSFFSFSKLKIVKQRYVDAGSARARAGARGARVAAADGVLKFVCNWWNSSLEFPWKSPIWIRSIEVELSTVLSPRHYTPTLSDFNSRTKSGD